MNTAAKCLTMFVVVGLLATAVMNDKKHKSVLLEIAEPGSAMAAKDLAPKYLMKLFTVVEDPVIEGDTATVNVSILNQKCVLTMHRAKNADDTNLSGWLVSHQSCVPTT
ncbi:hypothetical protein PSTH68_04425 [Pseudomonas syringae pv. theae]|uniref:Uncharacterized protein n=1 Tax=Pseudomonas syringae pv. theae TaxID=103985 RepID=A0A3M5MVJ4_PSESX|nr:hypothetical protein [Pseudomonas syringae]MBL3872691.1 hypothetical protein [Pseudomonas syringae pv. theae]RMT64151.1 hypothetical protein ALP44_01337 [Pseudomonas syringae pv. theae]GKQ28726.1 hypothetical protein PSTH68_04425 [Pseudomonas syringae pv. theae]